MEEGAEGGEEGQAGSVDHDLNEPTAEHSGATVPAPLAPATPGALAAPIAVVTAVALWLTRSFWLPGRYVVGFDTYAYSGPNLQVTERAVSAGRWPLLNDLIFGGVPHLGNPSAAALYPPQVLTFVLETNRAMGVLVAAHVVLLGVGMVVLTRRLGLGPVGTGTAGVVVVGVGATLTKTVQFEQILVIAWIPLLLASIHAVLHARRPWAATAAVSATTAAMLLAGHPQLVYQSILLALAATIGFAWSDERWRRLPHLALGAGLGALIALPQLVAVLRATADSAIAGGRDLAALESPMLSVQAHALARAVLGTVQDRDQAAFAGGFESIGFVGVAVAVLAVVGAVQAWRDHRWRPWGVTFAAIGALALIWSLGPRTVLFRVAFEVLPGFDLARASARWLVVVAVVVALFAGVGADAAVAGLRRVHAAVAGGVALAVAAALAIGIVDVADRRSAAIWAVTAVLAVGLIAVATASTTARVRRGVAAGVIGVAAVELLLMSLHSVPQQLATDEPFTAHETATSAWLAEQTAGSTIALTDDGAPVEYQVPGFRPNANVLASVPSIDGYDGGVQVTERWADALRRFTTTPPIELPLRNSLQIPIEPDAMARLGVRFVLLDRDRPAAEFLPGWAGPRATDADFEVWENPAWIGDAAAWPIAEPVTDPADRLRDDPDGTAGVALVDDADAALSCDAGIECRPIGLDVDRRSPEHLVVDVDLDAPAIVTVARQALPGWEVAVDGAPAEEVIVDGIFLGVEVGPGTHTVTWRYHAPWFGTTLLVSLLALAATIGLAIAGTVTRRA